MPRVTVIPSTVDPITHLPESSFRKKRVAAYARVSTDSDEQLTSYEAQKDYYEKFIRSKPEWEFAGMYADEGISGTSVRNRPGFNSMISEAMAGNIDLIVTKSVSRFARNTVDSLTMIRSLKEKGVGCYFEKENIYTLDSKGELLITIMSSLAQEESRSISQNVTWGKRKAMADGKVQVAYSSFLGYRKGADGKMEIDESQAETVRCIYRWFMKGFSIHEICHRLMKDGVKSPMGKDRWQPGTVLSILRNEKYKGDALLQKTYTADFLTHKQVRNAGEIQQYYVEDDHEAIIQPDEWEMVQAELKRRDSLKGKFSGSGPFSCRIVCADCGSFYGPKVWHSTDKYRKTIWRCNSKFVGNRKCLTPAIDEKSLKDAFVRAYNSYAAKISIATIDSDILLSIVKEPPSLDGDIANAREEAATWATLARKLVAKNASSAIDQNAFAREYQSLSEKFEEADKRLSELETQRKELAAKRKKIEAFLTSLKKAPKLLDSWDEDIWLMTIDVVRIREDGTGLFIFKDGTSIEEKIR